MLATNTSNPSAERSRPDIRVGDDHVVDALSHLRHEARLLTLAITGYITSPNDVQGQHAASVDPFNRDPDDDWGHDIEALAVRMTSRLEDILAAVEAGEQS